MLTSSLRCRAHVFTLAYQSLYNVVLLLLCCHILFSVLLTCSSYTNFFLYLDTPGKHTSWDHFICSSLYLKHLPVRYSQGSLPYLPQVFCSNVTSCLKLQILELPSLICFQKLIHEQFIHYVIIYLSNHFVSSLSPSKYEIHQDSDFRLVHCNVPHRPQCLAHERHSIGVLTSK